MHPNAGARLRKEIELLPDILQNPSTSLGDSQVLDSFVVPPDPTNASASPAVSSFGTGENGGESAAQI
jgi:hypothetical protein